MADDEPHAQILRLEDDIEELTEIVERCRKAILISKLDIATGGICLFALTLGVMRFDPIIMIGAIAAIIGGTVVFGSNTSTSKQTEATVKAAERLMAELIGKINLRVLEEAAIGQIKLVRANDLHLLLDGDKKILRESLDPAIGGTLEFPPRLSKIKNN